ncbi:LANO_0H05226g1_1 [Lachancea nothofagi CBS 11611]|uniref:LANO_0H05226g1_1 n=1 Tax=Lachancea nothofagi CBS 11611 TaxID=1266666 RepID=A0A1G4KL99_9SACH|nr:LANO_0H05226g1_1 [Lachancea nothofagi CBS 11611]
MKRSSQDYDNVIETTGIISIKDFAYDKSNALHYGFFGESSDEEDYPEHSDTESLHGQNENTDREITRIVPESGCVARESHGSRTDNSEDAITKRQSIILPSDYIVNKQAVALYDFVPENDNELELREGDKLFIGYRHGQGWLVAENEQQTRTGLVPEEYVSIIEIKSTGSSSTENHHADDHDDNNSNDDDGDDDDDEDDNDDNDGRPRPFYLTQMIAQSMGVSAKKDETDAEWEDIDDVESKLNENLKISDT